MNIKRTLYLIARWFYQWIRPRPLYYKKVKSIGVEISDATPNIIVSLTSFPLRIKAVSYTIESILSQTKKPNKVVLWLAEEQFPQKEKDLPKRLLKLKKYGLIIEWCEDIRSYKKLIPSLEKYPNDIIVTTDDDVYYPPTWLERLYNSYLEDPSCIHFNRGHEITFSSNGKLNKYEEWNMSLKGPIKKSAKLLFTGVGGVLYPPHSLHIDVHNKSKFLRLAPSADDFWFWAMAILAGTKCTLINNNQKDFDPVFIVNNKSLWATNSDGANDKVINLLLNEYPQLSELIKNNTIV